MIGRIRFHGRGGEGVKLASRIASRAAFLAGRTVQDSPLYGAERRGAPVVAFVRIADGPIGERGWIERPDAVVVMDDSLLPHAEAGVLDGVTDTTLLLANTRQAAAALRHHLAPAARIVALDVSAIALEFLGHHHLSAPTAGFVVRATGVAGWDDLARAVEAELGEVGLDGDLVARNLAATRRAFDEAPVMGLVAARAEAPPAARPARAFTVPRLPARIAAPSLLAGATSALRSTAGWRVYRPVIDLGRCTRCFLCFALCPEGAIRLDPENRPVVDYDHCKGCLVCVTECPPHAIAEVREPGP
jgi:pyruvate ferredoxin oxidoreductase gamma subunit